MSRRTARTGRGRGSGKGKSKQASSKKTPPAPLTMKQREAARVYADRRRRVQPLVSFDIPKTKPRPADKAKLTRYYNYLFGDNGVALGAKVAVRRKDPDKLLKLQQQFGQGDLPGVKAVFIRSFRDPVTDKLVRPKVKHRKNAPDVVSFPVERYNRRADAWEPAGEVETQFLPFDKLAMLTDPEEEIRRVAAELAELAGVDLDRAYFRVRNGSQEVNVNQLLDSTVSQVRFYQTQYANWQEWLDGLIIESATEGQHTLRDYGRAKQAEKERKAKIRTINVQHATLLRAIEKTKVGAMTEVLTRMATGSLDEVSTIRKTLERMRKLKLVMGDDSRWMLTAHGRNYLGKARNILPLFE